MCTTCAALRPFDPLATNDNHLTGTHTSWDVEMLAGGADVGGGATYAPFTLNQIANQLTDGYWNGNGENWRAFDLGADRTLNVDLSGLEIAGVRTITRMALQAWTDVSGIRFVEVAAPTVRQEVGDAANTVNTTTVMSVGQALDGRIGFISDHDYIRVTLTAGQTYTISMNADAGETLDTYLRLLGPNGGQLSFDDDGGAGTNSAITFRATTTGTYFIDAGAFNNETVGTYQVTVANQNRAADITFDDNDPDGAYATSELDGNTILSSFVNLQPGWSSDPISMNGYWFQTMAHEIGHALGLGHAGNYNGNAVWDGGPGLGQSYDNDSWQATIMSYFAQGDGGNVGAGGFTGDSVNPNIAASYAYLATLMPADIIAIQNLYGTNVSTRAGDTTYGNNSNVTGYLGQLMDQVFGSTADTTIINAGLPVALTIYDTGGHDRLDFSNTSANQRINLNALSLSNVYGLTENIQIARGVLIEGATGGSGRDRIIGNFNANSLVGNAGNDTLEGGSGGDLLMGGRGADRLDGGAGNDVASYAQAAIRVIVDMTTPSNNAGEADGDVYISINSVRGSAFNDRLSGNSLANVLQGLDGSDAVIGRGGNDSLYGGNGADTVIGGAANDQLSGGSSQDRFVFETGDDRIIDFVNNVDTIVLDRDLWGGANRTVQSVLTAFADDIGTAVIFRFAGGHTLRIDALANVNSLLDDISFI